MSQMACRARFSGYQIGNPHPQHGGLPSIKSQVPPFLNIENTQELGTAMSFPGLRNNVAGFQKKIKPKYIRHEQTIVTKVTSGLKSSFLEFKTDFNRLDYSGPHFQWYPF